MRRRDVPSWSSLRRFEQAVEPLAQLLAVAWTIVVVLELVQGRTRSIEIIGTGLWIFFAAELLLRLWLAPQKLAFFRRNWLTVLATVVPALRLVRGLRLLRLLRFARWSRVVRVAGTVNRSARLLRATIARRRLAYAAGVSVVAWLVGGAAMYAFERSAVPPTFEDVSTALWWSAMIIATMGTDRWPVTAEGRILSFLLAVYGFVVFGYITASLAALFMANVPEHGRGREGEG